MEHGRGRRRPAATAAVAALLAAFGCAAVAVGAAAGAAPGPDGRSATPGTARDPHAAARKRMIKEQIERRGVRDPRVLRAMESVPRHLFVPDAWRDRAYEDGPLPIGKGQTISQPYIVAFMTEAIRPRPTDRVLEIGTGSGYQAAVLASIVAEVYSIEIVEDLARSARERLAELGYRNVTVKHGDGYFGWPEHAPFDAIVVTAAPGTVPQPLLDQLKVGGRLVAPVDDGGGDAQDLVLITRTGTGFERRTLLPVRFVPMTGETRRPD
jgi:protein-L-isoaspartate(D-aspartate) O-methyltransferase